MVINRDGLLADVGNGVAQSLILTATAMSHWVEKHFRNKSAKLCVYITSSSILPS